jgi:glycosyltransferase involved in cell wall biosynthesis
VDGEEPEAVEAALRALLADPGLAKAMGQAGRRRAEECFSPERHAVDVEAIYLSVLARRESAR